MAYAVKILGLIDLASAFAFLLLVFGIEPYTQYLLFCGALLVVKGLFIFSGDILSLLDLISAVILVLTLFFSLPAILFWIFAFLLVAKGLVSFL